MPAPLLFADPTLPSLQAFLRSFSLALRLEVPHVTVSLLLPGATDSGFAAAGKMEASLAFTLPMGRLLGLVLSADAVAAAGLKGVMRGEAEIVPGLLNRAYVRLAALAPTNFGASFAALFFDPRVNPLTDVASLLRSLPVLLPGTVFFVLCLLLEVVCAGVSLLTATWLGLLLALLFLLSAFNVYQNGSAPIHPPRITTLADVHSLRRKTDLVAAWRVGHPPSSWAGVAFDGQLVALGVTAPLNAFITHVLLGAGRRWIGKRFDTKGGGTNRFAGSQVIQCFGAEIAASSIDGGPALVLDYSAPHSADGLWGGVLGMRDELREVAPGVLIGLGSMTATGGALNCAPFVLFNPRADKDTTLPAKLAPLPMERRSPGRGRRAAAH